MDLRQLPPLNAIKAFEAAARHESFSRAADELFVTHGAVSHQIRALEEELGIALFARDGKRVRLTDTGRRYATRVRTALMGLADATREVRAGDRERRLVVSMLSSFAARWVTPRIGSFIEAHPQWDLELLSTNALTDFARDDVDVAIRFGYGKYSGLHAELLLEEIFFPACAPNFNGGKLANAGRSGQGSTAALGRRTLAAVVRRRRPHRLAEPKRACCIRIRRTCCRRPSTARGSRSRAVRWRCTRSRPAAMCGYSMWMGRARGSILHLPAADARNRRVSRRSAPGYSKKWDGSNSFSSGLARRALHASADLAADALRVTP